MTLLDSLTIIITEELLIAFYFTPSFVLVWKINYVVLYSEPNVLMVPSFYTEGRECLSSCLCLTNLKQAESQLQKLFRYRLLCYHKCYDIKGLRREDLGNIWCRKYQKSMSLHRQQLHWQNLSNMTILEHWNLLRLATSRTRLEQ